MNDFNGLMTWIPATTTTAIETATTDATPRVEIKAYGKTPFTLTTGESGLIGRVNYYGKETFQARVYGFGVRHMNDFPHGTFDVTPEMTNTDIDQEIQNIMSKVYRPAN